MALLPLIRPLIILSPKDKKKISTHFIFNPKNKNIKKIYKAIQVLNPKTPIGEGSYFVDPFFGYFGNRFNPIKCKTKSFHGGVDMGAKQHTKVYPIAGGILEYSGYGINNGNYILLSHPDIISQDGFMLYSIYMNLHKNLISFNKYQKMLREISFHTYPSIPVPRNMKIAFVGSTTHPINMSHHMHLQLEFRHKDGTIVVIDPMQTIYLKQTKNITSEIKTIKEFKEFYKKNKKILKNWYPYWSYKIRGFK